VIVVPPRNPGENDDIVPNNTDARVIVTAKEAGTLRIVATSFQGLGVGTYRLTIQRITGTGE
jgi:hypothetical protein